MRFSTALLLILLVVSCNDTDRLQRKVEKLQRENDSLKSECSSKDIDLGRYGVIVTNMSEPCAKEFDSISEHVE
jgi:hypothetical protein